MDQKTKNKIHKEIQAYTEVLDEYKFAIKWTDGVDIEKQTIKNLYHSINNFQKRLNLIVPKKYQEVKTK